MGESAGRCGFGELPVLQLAGNDMKRAVLSIESTGARVAAALLLAGLPPVNGADEALGGLTKQGCFYTRDASDFDVLDKSNFIVYAPTKSRAFHVRIAPPSNELRFANALVFEGRGNRICGYAGESIAFGGGGGPRRYAITDVWQLDAAALEQLLDTYKSGGGKGIPERKDSDGAEVERDLSGDEAN
jgi:hypothetical protein